MSMIFIIITIIIIKQFPIWVEFEGKINLSAAVVAATKQASQSDENCAVICLPIWAKARTLTRLFD